MSVGEATPTPKVKAWPLLNRNSHGAPAERVRNATPPYGGFLVSIVLVGCATALSEIVANRFDIHHNLGMPFMIALLLAGGWGGMRPGLFAAALSFAIYRYFLTEPFHHMEFARSDTLPLVTFLTTATLAGGMSGRLSDRARSAADRLRRLTVLFGASRDFSAAADSAEVARRLVARLDSAVGLCSSVYVDENGKPRLLARSPHWRCGDERSRFDDGHVECRRLETARGEVGKILFHPPPHSLSPSDQEWVEALIQLGAIAIDRATLASEISDARLIAEREGLRTALLSSLSHDLRTPIATILASASSLAENPEGFDEGTKNDLLEAIQVQAERLNRYVSNLLDMTRLETGALILRRDFISPPEVFNSVISHMQSRLQRHRVTRDFDTGSSMLFVDSILLEQALTNIVDNAIKFAPFGSRIEMGARAIRKEILLWVADEGPGVPPDEIPRIFDKFFRGSPDSGRHAGVGLGLAVVRGVVEAFGGEASVQSPLRDKRGSKFTIRLPAHIPPEMNC